MLSQHPAAAAHVKAWHVIFVIHVVPALTLSPAARQAVLKSRQSSSLSASSQCTNLSHWVTLRAYVWLHFH
jgi:hypothetical protein